MIASLHDLYLAGKLNNIVMDEVYRNYRNDNTCVIIITTM